MSWRSGIVLFAASGPLLLLLACVPVRRAEAEPPIAQATPPPPPGAVPPPPGEPAPVQATPTQVPPGQWVYTQQYGWVWMTYGDEYTYLPPDGSGEPLEYVYQPSYGWAWLVAPWVWGIGPSPSFGARGPGMFAWYRHGWWKTPTRWRFRPAPEQGVAHRGVRPAPPRRVQGRRGDEGRGGEERGERGRPREGGEGRR